MEKTSLLPTLRPKSYAPNWPAQAKLESATGGEKLDNLLVDVSVDPIKNCREIYPVVERGHPGTEPVHVPHVIAPSMYGQDDLAERIRFVSEDAGTRVAATSSTKILRWIVRQNQPHWIQFTNCPNAGIVALDAVFACKIIFANVRFSLETHSTLAIAHVIEADLRLPFISDQ